MCATRYHYDVLQTGARLLAITTGRRVHVDHHLARAAPSLQMLHGSGDGGNAIKVGWVNDDLQVAGCVALEQLV